MHHAEILIDHLEKWSEIGQWPAVILHSALTVHLTWYSRFSDWLLYYWFELIGEPAL